MHLDICQIPSTQKMSFDMIRNPRQWNAMLSVMEQIPTFSVYAVNLILSIFFSNPE